MCIDDRYDPAPLEEPQETHDLGFSSRVLGECYTDIGTLMGQEEGKSERASSCGRDCRTVSRQCPFFPPTHLPTRPMTRCAYLSIAFTPSIRYFAP